MGLDVYLYKGDPIRKQLVEKQFNDLNLEYGTPEYAEAAKNLGLDEYGNYQKEENIEIPSTIDPDNLFKIGYFRSSYNSAGINSVIEDRIGKPGLYYIFPRDDKYIITPDWEESLKLCNELLSEFEADLEKTGKFSVIKVDNFGMSTIGSEKEALDTFMKMWEERKNAEPLPAFFGDTDWFSNRDGDYFLKPPAKVLAVYIGAGRYASGDVAYLVTEQEHEFDSYVSALKIVRETIEYVLAQPDKDKYYFHWSA